MFDHIDRKKTGLAIIMVGLMIMVIGIGNYFQDKLKATTLTQNNISGFKTYEINKNINYGLPEAWINSTNKVNNPDIDYESEFISDDGTIKGSIQLWKSGLNENQIIEKKKNELKELGIEKGKTQDVKLKNIKGVKLEYELKMNSKDYRKYDYIINTKGNNLVISFYIDKKNYKENTPVLLEKIVKTVEVINI
ncbi:MAG: hypothetical protein ACRCW0_04155 [Clostridium sp.]